MTTTEKLVVLAVVTAALSFGTVWLLPEGIVSFGPRLRPAIVATAFLSVAYGMRRTFAPGFQMVIVTAGVCQVLVAVFPSLEWLRVGSAIIGAVTITVGVLLSKPTTSRTASM